MTERQVHQKWNASDKLPSVKLLKDILKKLGHDSDLTSPYEKFHADLENQIQNRCSKLPSDLGDIERKDAELEIRNNVMFSLKWQRFFSGEILNTTFLELTFPNSGCRSAATRWLFEVKLAFWLAHPTRPFLFGGLRK